MIGDAFRSRFVTEPSYSVLENLAFGRMSFKGMNPEIEKMMENQRIQLEEKESLARETEINDEEMAAAYGNLKKTIGKKFEKAAKRKMEEVDEKKLLETGSRIVNEMQTENRTWKKEMSDRGKKRKFIKPKNE